MTILMSQDAQTAQNMDTRHAGAKQKNQGALNAGASTTMKNVEAVNRNASHALERDIYQKKQDIQ